MLPLLSQRAHTLDIDTSGSYAAMTIIIAQGTMMISAFLCGKILSKNSNFKVYFYLMALALLELILRGLIAANSVQLLSTILVQILKV